MRSPFSLLTAVAVAAVVALGVAACGDDSPEAVSPPVTTAPATTAPATTAPTATDGATAPAAGAALTVEADPGGALAFVQTTLTSSPGPTTITLTNASPVPHNIAVDGNGVDTPPSETIQGGGTADLSVDLPAGDYTYYCDVAGHRDAGMEGTLTVG